MRFAAITAAALLATFSASAQPAAQTAKPAVSNQPVAIWPVKDGLYVAHNFRFGTGETLPELNLHYLTLGTPHRNAAGHVDNAVLLLHGTGGDRRTLLNPALLRPALRPRSAARHQALLPHLSRRHRSRRFIQAFRRPAHEVPPL